MKVITICMLLFGGTILAAQSPFNISKLEEDLPLISITYDGSTKSVAEGDTVRLPSFFLLSPRNVKQLSVTANGCVYVLITYSGNRHILIKSNSDGDPPQHRGLWRKSSIQTATSCLTEEDVQKVKNIDNVFSLSYGSVEVFVFDKRSRRGSGTMLAAYTLEFK